MILRCPFAERVQWRYPSAEPGNENKPTYYRGQNRPEAVVLHISEGFAGTARAWAAIGKYPKSWHFFVCRDGAILQHLEPQDGGYHAGITDAQARQHPPTWTLWKGLGINVNVYTIGIEHEGFYQGYPWPEAQLQASKQLCQWISAEWGIPYDREHFPAHAEIDVLNRVNDFAIPAAREAHYRYLFEEDDMSAEDKARLDRLERIVAANGIDVGGQRLVGEAALTHLETNGSSAFLSISNLNDVITKHQANHPSGGGLTADEVAEAFHAGADKILGG